MLTGLGFLLAHRRQISEGKNEEKVFSFLSFCYGILWADQDKDHEGTNNAHWYQAKLSKTRKERVTFLHGLSIIGENFASIRELTDRRNGL